MQENETAVSGKPFGRRSFLKGSAVAAAAVGAGSFSVGCAPKQGKGSSDEPQAQSVEEAVYPVICRGGCGGGCQMNVHVRDGKIVKTSRREQSDSDTTMIGPPSRRC